MPKVIMLTGLVFVSFVVFCGSAPTSVFADITKVQTQQTGSAASAKSFEQKLAGYNAITKMFAAAGSRACLDQMDQVTNFLSQGTQTGVFAFIAPANVDQSLQSVSLEAQLPDKNIFYASTSSAQKPSGGCGTLYESVAYWTASCDEVAQKSYAQLKPAGVIQSAIQILDGGPFYKVFLMPAGQQGCVSIKKEVLYLFQH